MVKTRKIVKINQPINEIKRMQQLAGLINESLPFFISDDDKALGTLFHPGADGFEWDEENVYDLVKDMGYKDYDDVAGETMHYTSPGDRDEMTMFRNLSGNPNLQPEDITIGMFKQSIEHHFPERDI
jgi:hypothetical protein